MSRPIPHLLSAMTLDDMAELLQAIELIIKDNTDGENQETEFYYLLAEHCREKLISISN